MSQMDNVNHQEKNSFWKNYGKPDLYAVLLVLVMAVSAWFRIAGQDWDQEFYLHPDERFLTMVTTSIESVDSIDEYFNTEISSLNPHNRGYGFYVYGTFPLFLVRYIAEWADQTALGEVILIGRSVSAVADVLTILVVFLIAQRLYKKPLLSLLASAFYGFSVMMIQLSHYYTVDVLSNLFTTLAIYFAICILKPEKKTEIKQSQFDDIRVVWELIRGNWDQIGSFLLFGVSLGLAVSCKINTAFISLVLPAAVLIRYFQLEKDERPAWILVWIRNVFLAAVVSLLVFRIFQPFAFTGPGFFGMIPNQQWIQNIKEIFAQSGGNVDFPPALQWARRPLWFGLSNLVKWGLGLPLGILAFAGLIWITIRIFHGEWKTQGVIWFWTVLYFIYQSLSFTSSMRYFISIYPTLAIIAAWTIFALWQIKSSRKIAWMKILSVVIGIGVFACTLLYANAFTQIYIRPVTRIAASEWIYQNVPGAVNVYIDTDEEGDYQQPLSWEQGRKITVDDPYITAFQVDEIGQLSQIEFAHIRNTGEEETLNIVVQVFEDDLLSEPLAVGMLTGEFPTNSDERGNAYDVFLNQSVTLVPGKTYYLHMNPTGAGTAGITGYIRAINSTLNGEQSVYLPEASRTVSVSQSGDIFFIAKRTGTVNEIYFPHVVDILQSDSESILKISLMNPVDPENPVSTIITDQFGQTEDHRGGPFTIQFDEGLLVEEGRSYSLRFELLDGSEGNIAFYGSEQVRESTWDDSLPYGVEGYSSFNYYTGVYPTKLNFEMYWDDNVEKLDRFYTNLDLADYLFISSRRQWGTTVRVPERYPLTTAYYRNLIGCPLDQEILDCYSTAEPGMYSGNLGYELVEVFQSEPEIGSLFLNSQYAEEAFTVYDHPKVFIFRKTDDYDSEKVKEILGAVDLDQAIHLTPKEASEYQGNLLLSETRAAEMQQQGTWSEIFNREDLLNKHLWIAALVWYLIISLIGWINYPLTRIIFGGLSDKGIPLVRLLGVLLLAFLVWAAGSAGVPFTPLTISITFLILLIVNGFLFWRMRTSIISEIKKNWRYILYIELIVLGLFLFFLLLRLGNPDLWHPHKGGEKPMDFSYFNAILKSETFPPYDPWFAGGYLNYYYFGWMICGVPVKWLGIMPSIAYNLVLPLFFALTGIGAFSVGWNLFSGLKQSNPALAMEIEPQKRRSWTAGLLSMTFVLIIGNLGILEMVILGLQRLAVAYPITDGSFLERVVWTIQGMGKFIGGEKLPIPISDWYWTPSRALPHGPITEFPFFTFIYADLHAHLMALPLTIGSIAWTLSFLKRKWQWLELGIKNTILTAGIVLLGGGLIIGSLIPTNTWDIAAYLPLALIVVFYTVFRYSNNPLDNLKNLPQTLRKILMALLVSGALLAFCFLLYKPYLAWYGQGYTAIEFWDVGNELRSPIIDFLKHWGIFLSILLSWVIWQVRNWMSETPVSFLTNLKKRIWIIEVVLIVMFLALVGFLFKGVQIALIVVPAGLLAMFLMVLKGKNDIWRLMNFMLGTGLLITLFVELFVIKGDIGRMNTVFKFYLQVWTIFGVISAVAFVDLLRKMDWGHVGNQIWRFGVTLLLIIGLLFPIIAGTAKVKDRISSEAPHTLDGMEYMKTAVYYDFDTRLELKQDYEAIVWMQENIKGSPVIVEANTTEYRWGSRFTIYTGLPGVVGWNWHQRQQRVVTETTWVTDRVEQVKQFYSSYDQSETENFLQKYNVQYIVLGQLEKAMYEEEPYSASDYGWGKFEDWEGQLWEVVYQKDDTTIYKVLGE